MRGGHGPVESTLRKRLVSLPGGRNGDPVLLPEAMFRSGSGQASRRSAPLSLVSLAFVGGPADMNTIRAPLLEWCGEVDREDEDNGVDSSGMTWIASSP